MLASLLFLRADSCSDAITQQTYYVITSSSNNFNRQINQEPHTLENGDVAVVQNLSIGSKVIWKVRDYKEGQEAPEFLIFDGKTDVTQEGVLLAPYPVEISAQMAILSAGDAETLRPNGYRDVEEWTFPPTIALGGDSSGVLELEKGASKFTMKITVEPQDGGSNTYLIFVEVI